MSALFHNDFDRLLKERMQSHGGVDTAKFKEATGKIREGELAKGRERSARFRAAHPELANGYNREAQRKYRETHREEIAGRMKAYREAHKDVIRDRFRKWYAENRETCLEQQAKWREENRDRIREYQRKYREANLEKEREKNCKWREAHKEEQKAYQREWYLKNREKILAKRKAKAEEKETESAED